MFLFVDTEVDGPFHFEQADQDARQPSIVQIAAILTDKELNELSLFHAYVAPQQHKPWYQGTTIEMAKMYGVPIQAALTAVLALASKARFISGHNIDFDRRVLLSHVLRFGNQSDVQLIPSLLFCTMMAATPYCNILHPTSEGELKWPKLREAVELMLGEKMIGEHDAMADCRYSLRIAREIKDRQKGKLHG